MEFIIFNYELILSELLNTKVKISKIINNKRVGIQSLNGIKSNFGEEFQVFDNLQNKEISKFKLIQMPGCCGICISTGVFINTNYRNKGVNTILNQFRIDISKKEGFGILLCTDRQTNNFEIKTLNKNNWEHIYNFKNPRTNNIINISLKNLTL